MTRRKSADFRREATKEPYELELESGDVVVFRDPNRLETESAFDMARGQDPEAMLRSLLSEAHWPVFWAEYRSRPLDETNALSDDVMTYYGANRGERRNSPL